MGHSVISNPFYIIIRPVNRKLLCTNILCLIMLNTILLSLSVSFAPLLSTTLYAAQGLSVSGYIKNFSMVYNEPKALVDDRDNSPIGVSSNRLRLKVAMKTGSRITFNAAYDLSPRIQDPSLFQDSPYVFALDPSSYRLKDLDALITHRGEMPDTSFGLYQNLDRLFATLQYGFGDIYIGRQAIAWGSAHMVNPTDILAPFSFTVLDQEERFGVDAIRVRIPLGMMSELDTGYVFGRDFSSREHAFFLRGKGYIKETDVAFILLGFKTHALMGLDLTRSLLGAGVWFEAAYVKPDLLQDSNASDDTGYTRISLGLDGSLTERLYGFMEYHFSSAGTASPGGFSAHMEHPAYREGGVYLMGQHYLGIGGSYQLHPLAPLMATLLCNLRDGSCSLSTQLEYNIAKDIYIAAGVMFGIGRRPTKQDPSADPGYHSEFGAYPDKYWTSFRVYF